MKKTSFKQKLLLIVFGIFLALILLEISLRVAGSIVLYLQEQHNHVSFNLNEYRILCLGESTTALGGEDSYPSQLEQMLNSQSHQKRFIVINRGIVSINTDYILRHIEQNLDIYKPQLVVVMMGINDIYFFSYDPSNSLWWGHVKLFFKNLRVYKLAHLLYEHGTQHLKEIINPIEAAEEDFLKQCIERFSEHMSNSDQYQQKGQLALAQQEMEFARQSIIEASSACIEIARCYRLYGSSKKPGDIMKQAIDHNPNYTDIYHEWYELVQWFRENKHYELQEDLNHAFGQAYVPWYLVDPMEARLLALGKRFDIQGQYGQEEAFYLEEISLHPENARLYQVLGQFYQREGKENSAKEYFKKSLQVQRERIKYYPTTLVNYRLILDKILSRNIKVVVMQYPLTDISSLKDYLGQRNGVFYVENRQNFEQALTMHGGGTGIISLTILPIFLGIAHLRAMH